MRKALVVILFLAASALPVRAAVDSQGYLIIGVGPQRPHGMTAQEGERLGLVPAVCPRDIPGVENQGGNGAWCVGTLHAGEPVWGRRIGDWFAIRYITRCGNRVRKGGWRIPPPPTPTVYVPPTPQAPPNVTVNVTLQAAEQPGWVASKIVTPGPVRYHERTVATLATAVSTPVRVQNSGNAFQSQTGPQLVMTQNGPMVSVGGALITLQQYQQQISQSSANPAITNVLNNGNGSASGTSSTGGSQTGTNTGP